MSDWSQAIEIGLVGAATLIGAVYFISGVEDLALDIVAIFKRLKPTQLSAEELKAIVTIPERHFAIVIPAWHEGEIIKSMLIGNLRSLNYKSCSFFVGCYPNDELTLKEVQELAKTDDRVIPVVNSRKGPTSKGQMLNEIIEYILSEPSLQKTEGFLMQDAEDIIDPWALKIINYEFSRSDYVQIPVFSLQVRSKDLVAGTYVDEFSESHTKDMLVRAYLGAAIPSAGVGTGLTRNLVEALKDNYGSVFYENSLTEDYELGVRTHLMGFKEKFVCCYFIDSSQGRPHFIATREYFPKRLLRSIRQKTRWTLGISIQGWKNLGWKGSFWNRYFLYRDRRGLVTNLASGMGYPIAIGLVFWGRGALSLGADSTLWRNWLTLVLLINAFLMFHRLVQRILSVKRVYGLRAIPALPIRWPLSVAVNFCACLNAIFKEIRARLSQTQHVWNKTEHELPVGFGLEEAA